MLGTACTLSPKAVAVTHAVTCPAPQTDHTTLLRVRIRLRAWGATAEDVDRAIREAGKGWGARNWDFVEIERLTGVPCPLPRYDPKSIYADAGFDWAYVAYRAAS